jgi:hypothetical protein
MPLEIKLWQGLLENKTSNNKNNPRTRPWQGTLLLFLFLLTASLFVTGSARLSNLQGDFERIKNFESQLTVSKDGSIMVTETIQVVVAGNAIKRGIYRDFPTIYRDREGNRIRVDFRLLSVERGGQPEPYQIERRLNGLRIFIGRNEANLVAGVHTYVLTYKVTRVVSFYQTQDQLFWNVTGQAWSLPIEKASAIVILPSALNPEDLTTEAYTGTQGEQGQYFAVARKDASTTRFVATRPLEPGEGMSIVLSWPKGVVQRPDFWQRTEYIFRDSRGSLAAFFGLLLVTAWYLVAWILVGRDPHKGRIKPVFIPPQDISPGAMRFLMQMGFDFRTFVAVILSLAHKGHLEIKELGNSYSLKKLDESTELSPEERAVKNALPAQEFALDRFQQRALTGASKECRQQLTKVYKGQYFATNRRWLIPGIVLSVLFAVTGLVFALLDGQLLVLPAVFGLIIWSLLLSGLGLLGLDSWRRGKRLPALVMVAAEILLLLGWFTALGILSQYGGAGLTFVLTMLIQLNLLFSYLMKAPTAQGRRLMDKVEGFRLYLVMTREDFHGVNPPQQTPALFAANLPYAYALDVDYIWAQHFAETLQEEAWTGNAACPAWFKGKQPFDPVRFATDISSVFTNSLSAASHGPASLANFSGSSLGS